MSIQHKGTPIDSADAGIPYVTPMKPLSVTIKTAREITGLGNTTIYELIKIGKLKTAKVGRRTLVLYESLKRRLRQMPRNGRAPK